MVAGKSGLYGDNGQFPTLLNCLKKKTLSDSQVKLLFPHFNCLIFKYIAYTAIDYWVTS